MSGSLPRLLLCLVVVAVVHGPVLLGYFQADDFVWVEHGTWSDSLRSFGESWGLGTAYRPLTRLSYGIDAHVFGARAAGWHAVNLVLHGLNGALVAAIARRVGWRWTDAAAAAYLFLTFPMDWETVDWISGRTGLLSLLFGLLALRAWLATVLVTRGFGWGVAEMCLWQVSALLCYEPAVVFPGVLAGVGLLLVADGKVENRVVLLTVAVSLAVCLLFWMVRWVCLGTPWISTDLAAPFVMAGLVHNLLAIGAHAWRYLSAPLFLAVVFVLGLGLASRRGGGAVAAVLLICVLLYLPFARVAGFTERFAYLGSVPFAFALVMAGRRMRVGTVVQGVMIAVIIVGFAARSFSEARDMRKAGDTVRSMLASIRGLSGTQGNLVFFGVPDNAGRFYLLRGAFEQAAAAAVPRDGVVARVQTVCGNPVLLSRVVAGPSSGFAYDAASGGFVPIALSPDVCRQALLF